MTSKKRPNHQLTKASKNLRGRPNKLRILSPNILEKIDQNYKFLIALFFKINFLVNKNRG
jgi:hypothetical protein